MDDTPPRSTNRRLGDDERDPYDDRELNELPPWWQRNVAMFDNHRMRPYRPPTFLDGKYVPALVDELEEELGVDIRIRKRMPSVSEEDWEVLVDGTVAIRIDRCRTEDGQSIYRIDGDTFADRVAESVDR